MNSPVGIFVVVDVILACDVRGPGVFFFTELYELVGI